ncbi:hypothetical protein GP486_001512 [Trichoglossum hirsutum]|uniref:Protein kinase domain-containing protein n=1 Tax=Trichoglossum hirsutum TaxID=265104 RepID=A0A9P8LGP8_9PEZI|nr:hypothetical protein GP486_001512 [Trichoglossum hirsutum]
MGWQLWKIYERKETAQAFALLWNSLGQLTVVFEYNAESPQSLESQIYTDLCALSDNKPVRSFPNKSVIRSTVVEAVGSVWTDFSETMQCAFQSGKALQIRTVNGALCGLPLDLSAEFAAFCSLLKEPTDLLNWNPNGEKSLPDVVDLQDVCFQEPFESYRGACLKISLLKNPKEFLVFKGVSFFDYLRFGPKLFQYQLAASYREIQMINTILPRHPNIMPPPKAFVVIRSTADVSRKHLVSGSIYPIYKNGSLAAVLNNSLEEKIRIALNRKAKWCFQLASALHQVHFVARSWHQDIKPPNLLLDDADSIVIIDWEQCGANSFVLAPEANGTFDVVGDVEGRRPLRYIAYDGPQRINDPIAIPEWNVFPEWVKECPEAAELAEVYSLGKTMWLILEQVNTGHGDGEEDYASEVIQWSPWSEDIPHSWKKIVGRCIEVDPNSRIRMKELCQFWEDQWNKLEK